MVEVNTWQARAGLPVAVSGAVGVADPNGFLWVIGGDDGSGSSGLGLTDATRRYDVAADEWSTAFAAAPAALGNDVDGHIWACAALVNGVIWVFTLGRDADGPVGAVYAYDIGADSWTTVDTSPAYLSDPATAPVQIGQLYAVADESGGIYVTRSTTSEAYSGARLWSFDPATTAFTAKASPPALTIGSGQVAAAWWAGGRLHLLQYDPARMLHRVYAPVTNAWEVRSGPPVFPSVAGVGSVVDRLGRGGVPTASGALALYVADGNWWDTDACPPPPSVTDYGSVWLTGSDGWTYRLGGFNGAVTADVVRIILDRAPKAPTLTGPGDGAILDRSIATDFTLTANDPDEGDTMSAFDLRYRRRSDGQSWTTVSSSSTVGLWTATASTFAVADWEWQARTADNLGVVGPWSASRFFTAHDQPVVPAITSPSGTVGVTGTLSWTVDDQDAYQWRRVADDDGAADASTVYEDSGTVEAASTRTAPLRFDVNDRSEHVQLRVRYGGVWSDWADSLVQVTWDPPPTPSYLLGIFDTSGKVVVQCVNPDPGSGELDTVSNEVWIRDPQQPGMPAPVMERRAVDVAPGGEWTYWTPPAGFEDGQTAQVMVRAVAATGSTADSGTGAGAGAGVGGA